MAQERDQYRQEWNELQQQYNKSESQVRQMQVEMLDIKRREETLS